MIGGETTSSKDEGNDFSACDGYLTGKKLFIEANKRIINLGEVHNLKKVKKLIKFY